MTEEVQAVPQQVETILQKIDRLISERQPFIVEKMRAIRRGEGLTFQGMSREQISAKFSVAVPGDATWALLRNKVSQINDLRLEANRYLRDLESEYNFAEAYLDQFKSSLNQEIIASNMASRKNDKISDKAREALVSKIYNIEDIGTHLANIHVETAYWKSIVQDLDAIFEKISQNMMALTSEAKWLHAGNQS
jgi:hypothetical protein